MDNPRSPIEGVLRLCRDLDSKVAVQGGWASMLSMQKTLDKGLECISNADILNMLREIDHAQKGLVQLKQDILTISKLKEVIPLTIPTEVEPLEDAPVDKAIPIETYLVGKGEPPRVVIKPIK